MVCLLHRATITNHSMKIYMVSLLHRATINEAINERILGGLAPTLPERK